MNLVGALFDLDKTLLDMSSAQSYARYLYRHGEMSRAELARAMWWGVLSRLALIDMHSLIPKLLVDSAGQEEIELRQRCDRWFAQDVIPHLSRVGQERVRQHQTEGHVVALVSASTQYVVGPMAEYLGIPGQFVCTCLESHDGRLTGRVTLPVCYGEGKVIWAERFASRYGVDLAASYFYTDSISDLPLLERVAHPVAVSPDPRLKLVARRRGWPIEAFF